jgi:hypothetical protein
MSKAYVHLPAHVEERRAAFIDGLARLGFIVIQGQPEPDPAGRRGGHLEPDATVAPVAGDGAAGGGALIVTENGYCGEDRNGLKPYAIALDGHAGAGRWYAPDDSRLRPSIFRSNPSREAARLRAAGRSTRPRQSQMRSPHDFAARTSHLITRATGLR